MIGLGPTLGRIPWHEKLRRTLARGRGARLGEATVVSRQLHMHDSHTPQITTILSYLDAGQVMYWREKPGEVIHLDIWHQVADVDHRRVAAAIRAALAGVPAGGDDPADRLLIDYLDLCTGTGSGRVTGELTYGNPSVRAAHRNHVHVAGRLADDQLPMLHPLICAIEQSILEQNIELRRIEKVNHVRYAGHGPALDLSNYRDQFDSLNRGNRSPSRGQSQPGGSGEGGAAATDGQSLRAGRNLGTPGGAGALQGSAAGGASGGGPTQAGGARTASGPGLAGQAEPMDRAPATGWDALEDERRLQSALELSRRLGSPDELKRVLDELSREQGWSSLYGSGSSSQVPFVIRQLEDEGLLRREIRGLRLTESGRELARYLDRHLRDVKLRFRKLIRRMPGKGKYGRRPGASTSPPSADVRYGPIRGAAPAEPGTWLGDLAVPETLWAGLKRTHLERIQSGGAYRPGLRLERRDVHVHLRSGEQPLNICLLIDASASMAGRRILAAKHLARHLLVSTRDRVAVIAFQERDVKVYVPFTRDWTQVEEGLSRIQPMGLTPLAHGLTQSLDLIRESRVRRPLLLLITDGIPTVPKWTIDPLADAMEAARQVGLGRIPFGCIGLQPSRRYLEELARVADGTLHVVEELDEDALISIAHHERHKTAQRAK